METGGTPFANPGVLGARQYVPGKSVQEAMAELGLKEAVKMASNENPFGSSPGPGRRWPHWRMSCMPTLTL